MESMIFIQCMDIIGLTSIGRQMKKEREVKSKTGRNDKEKIGKRDGEEESVEEREQRV
jgi:hypothetical protein